MNLRSVEMGVRRRSTRLGIGILASVVLVATVTPGALDLPEPRPRSGPGPDLPVLGELVGECDASLAVAAESLVEAERPPVSSDLPTLREVLPGSASWQLRIVGGFVPGFEDPRTYVPISAAAARALVPDPSALATRPVLGRIPVVCSPDPIPIERLPREGSALGLFLVFDETGEAGSAIVLTGPSGALEREIRIQGFPGGSGPSFGRDLADLVAQLVAHLGL